MVIFRDHWDVLKQFENFTRKYLRQSLFANKVVGSRPAVSLRRDSIASAILRMLWNSKFWMFLQKTCERLPLRVKSPWTSREQRRRCFFVCLMDSCCRRVSPVSLDTLGKIMWKNVHLICSVIWKKFHLIWNVVCESMTCNVL